MNSRVPYFAVDEYIIKVPLFFPGGISAGTKEKHFIKYLLSEEYHTETLNYRWLYYSVLDAANDAYFQDHVYGRAVPLTPPKNAYGLDSVDVRQEDFDELMDYTRQITGAYFSCAETNFMRNMRMCGFLSGEASYEEAVREVERKLDLYLSE